MRDEFDLKETVLYYIRHFRDSMYIFFKWLAFSLLSGFVIGSAGLIFHYCMTWANDTRTANPVLILLLPLAGLVIVGAVVPAEPRAPPQGGSGAAVGREPRKLSWAAV